MFNCDFPKEVALTKSGEIAILYREPVKLYQDLPRVREDQNQVDIFGSFDETVEQGGITDERKN